MNENKKASSETGMERDWCARGGLDEEKNYAKTRQDRPPKKVGLLLSRLRQQIIDGVESGFQLRYRLRV